MLLSPKLLGPVHYKMTRTQFRLYKVSKPRSFTPLVTTQASHQFSEPLFSSVLLTPSGLFSVFYKFAGTSHILQDLSQYLEMAVTFYNLNSDAGVKKLDEYLLTRSYISGYQASKDDITVYSSLPKPPSSEYVNASRWYKHIDALLRISGVSGEGCGVIIEGSAPIPAGVATPPAADTKETEEEKKAAEEPGKSSVLMDVKPWDDETDMKKLEEAVRSVTMEGLLWGASKLVPVGYGIKKLQIMLTIVDDLVSVDELIESTLTVEPVNEYVQSCDIVAFNKICKLTCPLILLLINGYKV
nr:elongation factor 1-delta 1-like isoform X1 [Ipomoea batatas]